MTAEPIEQVVATSVQVLPDACEIALNDMLAAEDGLRSETLHVHRFGSPEARDRFLKWLLGDRTSERTNTLVEFAFDRGTAKLSALLDEIAARPGSSRTRPYPRRRKLAQVA